MDATGRQQIRLRAVAKSSLTPMQTLIETCERKLNDIQVRCDELPSMLEAAQSELELLDDTDHLTDNLKINILKAKFNELTSRSWLPTIQAQLTS